MVSCTFFKSNPSTRFGLRSSGNRLIRALNPVDFLLGDFILALLGLVKPINDRRIDSWIDSN